MPRIVLSDKFDVTMLEGEQRWKFTPAETLEEVKKTIGMYDETLSAVASPEVAAQMTKDLADAVPVNPAKVRLFRKGTDMMVGLQRGSGSELYYVFCKRC